MRTVYAAQFQIQCSSVDEATITQESISSALVSWVEGKYHHAWHTDVSVLFGGTALEPMSGHEVRAEQQDGSVGGMLTLDWIHPDGEDPSVNWSTSWIVARENDRIESSCVVRLGSREFRIRPTKRYIVGRPKPLTAIMQQYPCMVGESQIQTHVGRVTIDTLDQFIQDLLSIKRYLPLILLSRDAWSEEPAVEPELILRRVLGLANVFIIDKRASFELTGELGRALSCFNGAIRVYWPGFTRSADPMNHPLFLSEKLEYHANRGEAIDEHLFRVFSGIAALRFSEGHLTKRVRQDLDLKRVDQDAALRNQVAEHQLSTATLEEELLKSWGAADKLRAERDAAQFRAAELEEEIAQLKLNLAAIWEYRGDTVVAEEGQQATQQVTSVADALHKAEKQWLGTLEIWQSAIESAEKSNFCRPDEVFEALDAMNQLAVACAVAKKGGQSVGPWEQFFESRGIKYAPTESQNTLNMYGDERQFKNKGLRKQMLRHLTLGGGDRSNCLQIYFDLDDNTGLIQIGYCGVHLSYYGQRT